MAARQDTALCIRLPRRQLKIHRGWKLRSTVSPVAATELIRGHRGGLGIGANGVLYGAAYGGGSHGNGIVFSFTPSDSGMVPGSRRSYTILPARPAGMAHIPQAMWRSEKRGYCTAPRSSAERPAPARYSAWL